MLSNQHVVAAKKQEVSTGKNKKSGEQKIKIRKVKNFQVSGKKMWDRQ